jgi:hypothetical protein
MQDSGQKRLTGGRSLLFFCFVADEKFYSNAAVDETS